VGEHGGGAAPPALCSTVGERTEEDTIRRPQQLKTSEHRARVPCNTSHLDVVRGTQLCPPPTSPIHLKVRGSFKTVSALVCFHLPTEWLLNTFSITTHHGSQGFALFPSVGKSEVGTLISQAYCALYIGGISYPKAPWRGPPGGRLASWGPARKIFIYKKPSRA
jgi:hypothetical protein